MGAILKEFFTEMWATPTAQWTIAEYLVFFGLTVWAIVLATLLCVGSNAVMTAVRAKRARKRK